MKAMCLNCLIWDSLLDNFINLAENDIIWDIDQTSYEIYKKDINKTQKRYKVKSLDYSEQQILVRLKCTGDTDAFNKLIVSQLPYVIHIARKYQNLGLSLNDLISEGNIGLIEAIRNIEPSCFRVSSYTKSYIIARIWRAIYNYRFQIHYPNNIHQDIKKIQKSINQLKLQTGYRPSYEEIAKECHLDSVIVYNIMSYFNQEVSIEQLFDYFDNYFAFDNYINSIITPDFCISIKETDEDFYNESLIKELNQALRQLSDREQEIVKIFYGIGCTEMTLEEISDKFDLTRERVRQIRDNAIRKLRDQKSIHLRHFLG